MSAPSTQGPPSLTGELAGFQPPEQAGISPSSMVPVAIAFLVLTWITVLLRIYVRGVVIRSFGWDDWLMIVSLAFFTASAAILIVSVRRLVDPGHAIDIALQVKYSFIMYLIYILDSIFIKLSLTMFFLRVVMERWQRWIIIVSVGVYTLYSTAFLFVYLFQCGKPTDINLRRHENKCLDWGVLGPVNYLHGALNALLDWIFAILPIFILYQTKMAKQAKIIACFILGLGALGSVASLVRIAYMDGLNWKAKDYFGHSINITIASIIEPGLAIVAGSLATLRPLLRTTMAKLRITRGATTYRTEGGSDENETVLASERIVTRPQNSFALYGFTDDDEEQAKQSGCVTVKDVPLVGVVTGRKDSLYR